MARGRWAVPVVEDLAEENAVEEEACDEAVSLLVWGFARGVVGFRGEMEIQGTNLERMTLSSTSCNVVKIRMRDPRR